jgi:cytoplasmic iron level regulating protein YaaA (DUF328/UPF0246 family)
VNSRPIVVLLPPSKGKTDDAGAIGLPYADTIGSSHPLHAARRAVFAALLDSPQTVTEKAQLRLYGVGASAREAVAAQTALLAASPTRLARDRYHGVVYTNAGLTDRSLDRDDVTVLIVSGLLGVTDLDTPVPYYRLEFGANLPPVGVLSRFWGDTCGTYLAGRFAGCDVWNLLPQEHRGILSGVSGDTRIIDVRFVTPTGARANTARTKVAKGQIVAFLRQHGPMSAATFAKHAPLAPVWQCAADGDMVTAVCNV